MFYRSFLKSFHKFCFDLTLPSYVLHWPFSRPHVCPLVSNFYFLINYAHTHVKPLSSTYLFLPPLHCIIAPPFDCARLLLRAYSYPLLSHFAAILLSLLDIGSLTLVVSLSILGFYLFNTNYYLNIFFNFV